MRRAAERTEVEPFREKPDNSRDLLWRGQTAGSSSGTRLLPSDVSPPRCLLLEVAGMAWLAASEPRATESSSTARRVEDARRRSATSEGYPRSERPWTGSGRGSATKYTSALAESREFRGSQSYSIERL